MTQLLIINFLKFLQVQRVQEENVNQLLIY